MPKFTFVFWLAAVAIAPGQAVLEPPFGLKWGDSPEKLIRWAGRHQLDVSITLPGGKPDLRIVRVERTNKTLPGSEARALEARFMSGRMFELCVHHGSEEDSANRVEASFNELKRQLGVEHGALTANQQQRTVEDDFATRTLSFHREPVRGLFLLLAFTEVEDLLRKSREATFSLLYRNDNLRQQLEADGKDRPPASDH